MGMTIGKTYHRYVLNKTKGQEKKMVIQMTKNSTMNNVRLTIIDIRFDNILSHSAIPSTPNPNVTSVFPTNETPAISSSKPQPPKAKRVLSFKPTGTKQHFHHIYLINTSNICILFFR